MVNIYEMRDTVGIRNDMVVSLTIAVLCKIVNGFFMICPVWKIGWQYTYPPSALFPPLTSMFYLMYFVFSSQTTVYVGILSKDATWWEKMRSTYAGYDNKINISFAANTNFFQIDISKAQSEQVAQPNEEDVSAASPKLINTNANSRDFDMSSVKTHSQQLFDKKHSVLILSSFSFPYSCFSSYLNGDEKNDATKNINTNLDSIQFAAHIRQKGRGKAPIVSSLLLEDNDMGHFELRRAMMYLKGAKQYNRMIKMTHMERVWNTIRGKQIILALASTYYIFESLRYLGECDVLLDSIVVPRGEYRRIYVMFVQVDAPWQLNLSSMMRDQYLHLLQKYDLWTVSGAEKVEDGELYEKEKDPHMMATCNSSNSNNIQSTGKPNAGSKLLHALICCNRGLTCRSSSNSEDHIEELTALLFKIRHDIFQMIDPMIRKDLLKFFPIASNLNSSCPVSHSPSNLPSSFLNYRLCKCLGYLQVSRSKLKHISVLPIVTSEPSVQQNVNPSLAMPTITNNAQLSNEDSVIDIENGSSTKSNEVNLLHSNNYIKSNHKTLYNGAINTTKSSSYDFYSSRENDEDALSSFSSHNNSNLNRG
jgi:hypothetical protein